MLNGQDKSSPSLELRLLGSWALRSRGVPVRITGRGQRLIALLALRGQRPRPHVAGILWPDTTEDRALTSLRAAVLQTQRAVPGLLCVDRSEIGLSHAVRIDVDEVKRCASQVQGDGLVDGRSAVRVLAGAELLPGWYDEWVIFERERLQHERVAALERLAEIALVLHDSSTATSAAREAVAIEPLLESARAVAIRAHLQAGNRSAAVRELAFYCRLLERELQIAPSPRLVDLVRHLGVAGRLTRDRGRVENGARPGASAGSRPRAPAATGAPRRTVPRSGFRK